jgi:hypothetical protein
MSFRQTVRSELTYLQQCLPVARELVRLHKWPLWATLVKLHRASIRLNLSPADFSFNGFDWVPESHWPEYVSYDEAIAFQLRHLKREDIARQGDKAALKLHLDAHGINTPPLIALIGRTKGCDIPNIAHIANENVCRDQVHSWQKENSELLIKPCYGTRGQNVWAISDGKCLDGEGNAVNADILSRSLFLNETPRENYGYLVQPLLRAHDVFQTLNASDRLCTIRLYTVAGGGNVSVFGAEMKMPRAGRLTDNWRDGRQGNLIGPVRMEDGCLEAPWSGTTQNLRFGYDRLTHHPDTKIAFDSVKIPRWAEVLKMGAQVAGSFPETAMLGLDIALTNDSCFTIDVNNQISTQWLGDNHGMRPYLAKFYPEDF